MSDSNNQFDELIKQLVPVNELSESGQNKIINQSEILPFEAEAYIFRQGARDEYTFYLLDGVIEMEAEGEASFDVTTHEDRAKYPLAQVQPRKYSAKAKTPVKVLRIKRNALEGIVAQEKNATSGMEVSEVEDESLDWMTLILQSSLFAKIPAANIQKLFVMLEPVNMKAGEAVIKQGDPGDYYYIIQEGRCEVSRQSTPRSEPVKLAELNIGASFGEESLLSGKPRNATVTMLTDGVLMRLSKESFVELIKKPTLDSISFKEAQEVIKNGGCWLDVRSIAEYEKSSIKGSINIPIFDIRRESDKLQHNKQYIIFSNTKRRGSAAAFLLTELEFNVRYLENGLESIPDELKDELLIKNVVTEKAEKTEVESSDEKKPVEVADDNRDEDLEKLDSFIDAMEDTSEQKAIVAHREQRLKLQDRIKNIIAKEREKTQEIKLPEGIQLSPEQHVPEEKQVADKTRESEQTTVRKDDLEKQSEENKQLESKIESEKKELEALHERNLREKAELLKLKQEAEALIKKERESLQLSHAQQQAKLAEERKKIHEESSKIQQTLKEIQAAKLEAEAASKAAAEEARRLREQQTLTEEDLTKTSLNVLNNDIKSAESKLDQAQKKLIYAHQAEKTIASAKAMNEEEIKRHNEEAAKLQKQLEEEMMAWSREQEEHDALLKQADSHSEHFKKIREKTEMEKKEADKATQSLFDDIEKEMHTED